MTYRRKTPEEIQMAVQELAQEAKARVEEYARSAEGIQEYLDFLSHFYTYSPRNNALIKHSFPGAKAVKGYRQWQQEGFSVRKGERGIEILIPKLARYWQKETGELVPLLEVDPGTRIQIERKEAAIQTKVEGFTKGYVFDITQTTAEEKDYPRYYPNRREVFTFSGDSFLAFQRAVRQYAERAVNQVREEPLQTAAKGYYQPGSHQIVLNSRLSRTEATKTLLHELAHAKLHADPSPRQENSLPEREMQAEMTAYVVAKSFGLDPAEASVAYIANWTKNLGKIKELERNLAIIQRTARELIQEIDQRYGLELERVSEAEQNRTREANTQEKGVEKELETGPVGEKLQEPAVLIQNLQPLSGQAIHGLEKGGRYTLDQLEAILVEEKEHPFKFRYQLLGDGGQEPLSKQKFTKTISPAYQKGSFRESVWEKVRQLRGTEVEQSKQPENEREWE